MITGKDPPVSAQLEARLKREKQAHGHGCYRSLDWRPINEPLIQFLAPSPARSIQFPPALALSTRSARKCAAASASAPRGGGWGREGGGGGERREITTRAWNRILIASDLDFGSRSEIQFVTYFRRRVPRPRAASCPLPPYPIGKLKRCISLGVWEIKWKSLSGCKVDTRPNRSAVFVLKYTHCAPASLNFLLFFVNFSDVVRRSNFISNLFVRFLCFFVLNDLPANRRRCRNDLA